MEVDGQDQQIGPQAEASTQAQPRGLPSLRSRRPMDFVETMAQISLLERAMGGVTMQRGSPQAGRAQATDGSQGGSEFIPVPTAQGQGAGSTEPGEIPTEGISREQMHAMGELLQLEVTKEQRQQAVAERPRRDLTEELFIERQARLRVERELRARREQIRDSGSPTQRLVATRALGAISSGSPSLIPRPVQVRGPPSSATGRTGPPATNRPLLSTRTYAHVAQMPIA